MFIIIFSVVVLTTKLTPYFNVIYIARASLSADVTTFSSFQAVVLVGGLLA